MLAGDKSHMPGMVRASFGLYNTLEEIDALIDALILIQRREFTGRYTQERSTGAYEPEGWVPSFEKSYPLTRTV